MGMAATQAAVASSATTATAITDGRQRMGAGSTNAAHTAVRFVPPARARGVGRGGGEGGGEGEGRNSARDTRLMWRDAQPMRFYRSPHSAARRPPPTAHATVRVRTLARGPNGPPAVTPWGGSTGAACECARARGGGGGGGAPTPTHQRPGGGGGRGGGGAGARARGGGGGGGASPTPTDLRQVTRTVGGVLQVPGVRVSFLARALRRLHTDSIVSRGNAVLLMIKMSDNALH